MAISMRKLSGTHYRGRGMGFTEKLRCSLNYLLFPNSKQSRDTIFTVSIDFPEGRISKMANAVYMGDGLTVARIEDTIFVRVGYECWREIEPPL